MIKSLTLIPKSISPEKIDEVVTKLIVDMKQAKGLVAITGSEGHLMSPGGPTAYAMVIETSWESLEGFMTWAQSSNTRAEKDLLLQNGAILVYYEQKDF